MTTCKNIFVCGVSVSVRVNQVESAPCKGLSKQWKSRPIPFPYSRQLLGLINLQTYNKGLVYITVTLNHRRGRKMSFFFLFKGIEEKQIFNRKEKHVSFRYDSLVSEKRSTNKTKPLTLISTLGPLEQKYKSWNWREYLY